MDLRQLEIFVKVAELKSFSKAALALRLTQPTISEHIRTLEQELGVRLLDRLGRGAEATRAGQLLLSHATRMLQLQRETLQAMDSFQGRLAGDLHVAASTIPGEYVLPALIGRFKEKFPDIVVSLLIGDTRAAVDWVIDGRAEVAVVGAKLAHRAIEYRELMPDELVVVVAVPVVHPWHGKKEIALADLRAEPMLLREQGSGTRAAFESALAQAGQDLSAFRVVGEMGSTQAIKQAVKAGVGVSILSRRAIEDECRVGLMWALTVRGLHIPRSFYVATHRDRSRSPLAEAFRAFVESESV
jgi:DNA-binding transcriptional LysR family regulator